MRLRYMINMNIQAAFRRVDAKIKELLSHRMCPSIIRTVYLKFTGLIGGMVDMQAQAGAGGASSGGWLPKCSIF